MSLLRVTKPMRDGLAVLEPKLTLATIPGDVPVPK
jgi:hypothetical protein